MASKIKLVLRGFRPIEGDKARRHTNPKTGEVISRREFVKRAKRVEVEGPPPKPPKQRETQSAKRARWYANHVNRQIWNENARSDDYISFDEAKASPEFRFYEALIRSRYESDRRMGYEFFEELEDEFLYEDWGETP